MQLFSSWTGGDFLLFYMGLLAFCSLAAWWIPAHLREPGRPGGTLDSEDLAVLAGGRQRHADSVIAGLFAQGAMVSIGKDKLIPAPTPVSVSPAGKALLAQTMGFKPADAAKLLTVHRERIAARLRREGLLLRSDQLARLRWLSILPYGVLFMIGLYRQRAGEALGEPTGFLVVLLCLTAVFALIRFGASDPRTVAGIALVRKQSGSASRLRRAPQPGEAALAVALFGTAVLVGTPWEPVHAMRQQGDGGGSGDSGGSDGGSGCGGGGCGGCGG